MDAGPGWEDMGDSMDLVRAHLVAADEAKEMLALHERVHCLGDCESARDKAKRCDSPYLTAFPTCAKGCVCLCSRHSGWCTATAREQFRRWSQVLCSEDASVLRDVVS